MAKRLLVTGAGGFIGGFIVEEALSRGYEVWAAVRATTSREFLSDSRIRFLTLDFRSPDGLKASLKDTLSKIGRWDFVVHNLGATKCKNPDDFSRINYGYLRLLVETLIALDAVPDGFVMMSSMSVLGVGDEKGYAPFTASSEANPNTKYGVSKHQAESFLRSLPEFPYIIVRPTGVYGPHERDYYMMIKSIASGFDFSVGMRRQLLTFIYVRDLATAIFQALESGVRRKEYLLSDGGSYSQAEFRSIVKQLLGKRFVIPVRVPLWMLKLVSVIAEKCASMRGKASTLNRDKYIIMKQRNWNCDITSAQTDFGFNPAYDLRRGVEEAINWYKSAGWL